MQEHFPACRFVEPTFSSLSLRQTPKRLLAEAFWCLAEREGFEPSMGDKAHTPLAGEPLRPLGHLSGFRDLDGQALIKLRSLTDYPLRGKP